ncbi:5'-3' exoribonuclease 1 [Fasciola hepatica]|uniref:5'-3' exoribonuclease 1 n=1 Tax=Fasciola hepatica TaxID=6192 RepID=A0A4E0RYG4_FASHE|nr:5'-3' exoribonuclease 1 [Fasciola hepatica]
MGVPKFFRWISARYPCINQVIGGDEVPEIDHFYLDMNGILHTCSHPDGALAFMSEETIFQNIKSYILFLVELMKPNKTIFLAVDGVAPRAKMTQQRARRFQSAQETRKAKESAEKRGQPFKGEPFDPCVISPGTEFMERLNLFLQDFVRDQVTHNNAWRRTDVILSGHDCPGEGEHKIREYMSYRRAHPDYRPNERHCIYGMDADLIFLGLTTHEINMCILRENVVKSRTCIADEMPFCITYLSVLREYINLEFRDLEKNLPFPYDLEHIIDDWIFMAFLLGNDFIPHLPNLHIHAQSLLVLWDTYQVVLPQLGGYIVEYGRLNLQRFHRYLMELSKFEQSWFEEREADHRWMRGKRGAQLSKELENLGKQSDVPRVRAPILPSDKLQVAAVSTINESPSELSHLVPLTDLFGSDCTNMFGAGYLDETTELVEEGVLPAAMLQNSQHDAQLTESTSKITEAKSPLSNKEDVDQEELDDEDELIYKMHRRDYYLTKLGIQIDSESVTNTECLLPLVRDYVRMLQWILCYYFLKVPDWRFFYQYHYAPFAYDLMLYTKQFVSTDCHENELDWAQFDTSSEPLLPFVQQLMIMPSDAAYIVPSAYRTLMTSPSSPLAEFFPEEFSTDINGKIASWEAVVLIPFIDEKRLLNAMRPMNAALTKKERQRNKHKCHFSYPACHPRNFEYAKPHLVQIKHSFFRDGVLQSKEAMEKLLHNPDRTICPDFPSLHRLPFTAELRRIPVHIFELPSKLESMALVINRRARLSSFGTLEECARRILGKPTSVRWPHSAIVMPVRLMTRSEIWELENFNISPIFSAHSAPLRYRKIEDECGQETEANKYNGNCREVSWVDDRLEERERHMSLRYAVVYDDRTEDKPVEPVLVFSRKLDGWSIKQKSNGTNLFRLVPLFAESRAANGDELHLTDPEPCSSWFHSASRSRDHGKRPTVPTLRVTPAYGTCDGLTVDLLDLILEQPLPLHSCNHITLRWNSPHAFGLSTLFSPGQVVISMALRMHGSTGEVVGISTKKSTVSVRFYTNVGGSVDISKLRKQVQDIGFSCILPTTSIADQLGLPHVAVARLTGTFLVTLSASNKEDWSKCHNYHTESPKPDEDSTRNRNQHQEVWNIGLNLRRNKTRDQVLGWSRHCSVRAKWLFSARTVALLNEYHKRYPRIWDIVIQDSRYPHSSGPVLANVARDELDAVVEFLEKSGCRTAPLVSSSGKYVDNDHVKKLRDLLFPFSTTEMNMKLSEDEEKATGNQRFSPLDRVKWSLLPTVSCTPISLFMPISATRHLYPSGQILLTNGEMIDFHSISLKSFELMDRVVFCKNGQTVPLGLFGTVIGIPSDGTGRLEVMFDKEFDGATDIRGSGPCCALVHSSVLIKLPFQSLTVSPVQQSSSIYASKAAKFSPLASQDNTGSQEGSIKKPLPKWATENPPKQSIPWPTTLDVSSNPSNPAPTSSKSDTDDQSAVELKELNALLSHAKLNAASSNNLRSKNSEPPVGTVSDSLVNNTNAENSSRRDPGSSRFSRDSAPSPPKPPMPPASWSQQRLNHEASNATCMRKSQTAPQFSPREQAIPETRNQSCVIRNRQTMPRRSLQNPNVPSGPVTRQPRANEQFAMNRMPSHEFRTEGMNNHAIQVTPVAPSYQNPTPYASSAVNYMPPMGPPNWSNVGTIAPFFVQTPGQPLMPPQLMHTPYAPNFYSSQPLPLDPLQHHFYREFYHDAYMSFMGYQRPPR